MKEKLKEKKNEILTLKIETCAPYIRNSLDLAPFPQVLAPLLRSNICHRALNHRPTLDFTHNSPPT